MFTFLITPFHRHDQPSFTFLCLLSPPSPQYLSLSLSLLEQTAFQLQRYHLWMFDYPIDLLHLCLSSSFQTFLLFKLQNFIIEIDNLVNDVYYQKTNFDITIDYLQNHRYRFYYLKIIDYQMQMNVMQGYASTKNRQQFIEQPQVNVEINNTQEDLNLSSPKKTSFAPPQPNNYNGQTPYGQTNPYDQPNSFGAPPMQPMQPIQPMQPMGYGQPNGFSQPDPYAQNQQINMAVHEGFAGFGQYYFNALDPNIAKTNVPLKKESSMHVGVIVATLVLLGGVGAGIAIMMIQPQLITYGGIAIGVGYLVYVIAAMACSTIRGYITNLKKFQQYKQTYDKMVQGRGYFRFWIECYHYRTSGSGKNRSRKKVVTHTASENFFPQLCVDQSGNVEGIKDVKQYVFVNYLKKMYFSDTRSQSIVQSAYNRFIAANKRDTHQNMTNTFQIEGFEPEVGFCMQGQSPHNSIIFYVLSFLGLALPYACILERSVSRYQINILKRLTY